ncbi:hypothetical protein [Candidatus Hamiltonella endosymbiont of Tuberolachnus salignus]
MQNFMVSPFVLGYAISEETRQSRGDKGALSSVQADVDVFS